MLRKITSYLLLKKPSSWWGLYTSVRIVLLMHWLIDCFGFYAVWAMFQPYNFKSNYQYYVTKNYKTLLFRYQNIVNIVITIVIILIRRYQSAFDIDLRQYLNHLNQFASFRQLSICTPFRKLAKISKETYIWRYSQLIKTQIF